LSVAFDFDLAADFVLAAAVAFHRGSKRKNKEGNRGGQECPPHNYPYNPAPATFSNVTFRKNSAAASGSTELMNIPDPSSNPAVRVNRGITLTYQ